MINSRVNAGIITSASLTSVPVTAQAKMASAYPAVAIADPRICVPFVIPVTAWPPGRLAHGAVQQEIAELVVVDAPA